MLDNEAYFTRIYPRMASAVSEFGIALQSLRRHGDDHASDVALLSAGAALLRLARETCQLATRPPARTFAEFCADARDLVAATADHENKAVAYCARECTKHLRYLEAHEGFAEVSEATLPSNWLARDFVCNLIGIINASVFNIYRWRSQDPRLATELFSATDAEANANAASVTLIRDLETQLTGWCSYDKALMLYSLVRQVKPEVAVEVGIHGGRSIVPIALALRDNKAGHVVGIETWSAEAIVAGGITESRNDFFWSIADFASIKRSFLDYVIQNDLHGYIKLLEVSSERAARVLDEIQFIHIDGNHSKVGAARDVVNFLPKVRPGGVIVFDDIEWSSTGPALDLLMDTCRLLHVVGNLTNSTIPSCAAFVKL